MIGINDITIIMLILHFLGDFQLQNQITSEKKLVNKTYLNKHILTHALLLIIPLIIFILNNKILIGAITVLGILLSHWLIDILKGKITLKIKDKELKLFIIDQILHISIIIIITEIIFDNHFIMLSNLYINTIILKWILIVVLVTKPANILFKIGFKKYNINKTEDNSTERGAGALIGSLERVLSIIFLSMGQISAIGLIYTAKSIARFKEIEENRRFAEYYLIGTLYSILYAIIAYYLIIF